MKYNFEKKHYILKALLAVIVLFLIFVAVVDVKPTITTVEKTVPNGANA